MFVLDIKMHESYEIDRKQLEKQTEKSPRLRRDKQRQKVVRDFFFENQTKNTLGSGVKLGSVGLQ